MARSVLARDYPDDDGAAADVSEGYRTSPGETITSPCERMIDGLLLANGVDCIDEKRYHAGEPRQRAADSVNVPIR